MDATSTGTPGAYSALPLTSRPRVTAGLRCAPDLAATKTPAKTAIPHPQVTIRNPPLLPLVPFSATLATTPQPSRVSIVVPNTSERKTIPRDIIDSFYFLLSVPRGLKDRWSAGRAVGACRLQPGLPRQPGCGSVRGGTAPAPPGRGGFRRPRAAASQPSGPASTSAHLVEQLARDQPPEGKGRPADEDINEVPDLLMPGHVLQFADAEFAG